MKKLILPIIFLTTFITILYAPPSPQFGNTSLAWDAPTNTVDGSAITNMTIYYKVYYSLNTNLSSFTNFISAGTNLTATVSNLTWGKTYYFAATASDGSVSGLESEFSNVVLTNLPSKLNPPKVK